MAWPVPVEALWNDLQSVRAELLKETEGLSQSQADWRPAEQEWSVGEILHHLTLAEVGTGKLTSKLLQGRAAAPAAVSARPHRASRRVPPPPPGPPRRRRWSTRSVAMRWSGWSPISKAIRERSRQSIERLAAVDPRGLKWRHFTLGEMDLAQWWLLHVRHETDHLAAAARREGGPGLPPRREGHPPQSPEGDRGGRPAPGQGAPRRARHPAQHRAGHPRQRAPDRATPWWAATTWSRCAR